MQATHLYTSPTVVQKKKKKKQREAIKVVSTKKKKVFLVFKRSKTGKGMTYSKGVYACTGERERGLSSSCALRVHVHACLSFFVCPLVHLCSPQSLKRKFEKKRKRSSKHQQQQQKKKRTLRKKKTSVSHMTQGTAAEWRKKKDKK